MRFSDKLLGSIGGGGDSLDNCPYCGRPLSGFGCLSCDVEFVMEGGKLVERGLSSRGSSDNSGSCEMCQASLHGADRYLPYEDGSNSRAYIKCSSCGHENNRYGFGEDDD
jgi:hypothetical protein